MGRGRKGSEEYRYGNCGVQIYDGVNNVQVLVPIDKLGFNEMLWWLCEVNRNKVPIYFQLLPVLVQGKSGRIPTISFTVRLGASNSYHAIAFVYGKLRDVVNLFPSKSPGANTPAWNWIRARFEVGCTRWWLFIQIFVCSGMSAGLNLCFDINALAYSSWVVDICNQQAALTKKKTLT